MTGLRFTKDHEYLRLEGDAAVVGITDYAQQQLGDIVFVDLPKVGKKVSKGSELAVIESVKAASEVYAPISGEVIEVNPELAEKPALVNEDPLQGGWLVKLKVESASEAEGLMDADAYAGFVKTL
ncbi:glycine cleavage system protein GcvH [Methylocystis sp. IM3]|jgi:glycine cleavage system H protein|uniref:glycine cleavage system protein GcvH n=1 Tax=unclassified Methylocystis TaxID=2625913 RepID=UPI000FA5F984|nr:MAG: glycine cleavage system protein GcvH [Hyphomicrobiales bacterium]